MKRFIIAIFLIPAAAWWLGQENISSASPALSNYNEKEISCKLYADTGDCEFYRCFERRTSSAGYAMGFAYKYCNRFTALHHEFNKAGRIWIHCVRNKLMLDLEEFYAKNPSESSAAYREFAFGSYAKVYNECGFCDIWTGNKQAFTGVFGSVLDSSNIPSSFSQCSRWILSKLKTTLLHIQ